MGYQNLTTPTSDYRLLGGTFATVGGDKNEFTLNDLKVKASATLEPTWIGNPLNRWQKGVKAPNFAFNILDANGGIEKTYYWQYYKEGSHEEPTVTKGWFKKEGTVYVPATSEELAFAYDAGQTFWISGVGCSLVPAGQVSKLEIEFPTPTSDYAAIGNGTPVDLTLGDLTVTASAALEPTWIGNPLNRWQKGVKAPNFAFNILDANGGIDKTYYWQYYKEGSHEEPTITQGWFKKDGTTYVALSQKELDAIEIPAGQGYWVAGSGCTLNIPAPEL